MRKEKKKLITDGVEILDRLYFRGRPREIAALDDERLKLDIAQQIYDLRTAAHLSQRALAARVGTTASVISRLEDTDYQGHSVSMLRRVAKALGCRIEVLFVPLRRRRVAGRTVKSQAPGRNGRSRRAVA
jgi:ribosome-binding protein aMBF1 (putative translation factor)